MNCTKMPGKFWRIYMSEPTGEYVFAKDQQKAYQEVANQLGIGFTVGKPHWQTAWDVRNNIADSYRNGHMLICGDASHVSSLGIPRKADLANTSRFIRPREVKE